MHDVGDCNTAMCIMSVSIRIINRVHDVGEYKDNQSAHSINNNVHDVSDYKEKKRKDVIIWIRRGRTSDKKKDK